MIDARQHTGNAAPVGMTSGESAAAGANRAEAGTPRAESPATAVAGPAADSMAANGRSKEVPENRNTPEERVGTVRTHGRAGLEQADTGLIRIGTAVREAGSLRIAGDSTAFTVDSLYAGGPGSLPFGELGADRVDIPEEQPVPWRDTTVSGLFGECSATIQPERIERPLCSPLTDNAVFQGFVLLLAATYATLLYRNLGDIRCLLNRISRDKTSGERLSEEPGSSGFARFLNLTTAIGILFMGVVVVKYGDSLMPPGLGRSLSHGAVLALSLLATLAWGIVILFQAAVVRIIGAVTLSQPFIAQLVQLRQTFFSLAVIIASPALLLFALCPRGTGSVWFFVGAAELIITAVLYLKESLNLFISKKISILHWFLYLCTVEIFPISLLWLLAAR